MSSTTITSGQAATNTTAERPVPVERRRVTANTAWSAVGALTLVLFVYVFAHWILSGQAHATPTGVTPVPAWIKTMALVQQLAFGAGSLALFYLVVVREWRRAGHLTLNGMSYICIATAWWQDRWLNFINPQISYSAQLVELGLVGREPPRLELTERPALPLPVLWYLGVYPLLFCGATILVLRGMARARGAGRARATSELVARDVHLPGYGRLHVEFFFVRTGMYQYAAASAARASSLATPTPSRSASQSSTAPSGRCGPQCCSSATIAARRSPNAASSCCASGGPEQARATAAGAVRDLQPRLPDHLQHPGTAVRAARKRLAPSDPRPALLHRRALRRGYDRRLPGQRRPDPTGHAVIARRTCRDSRRPARYPGSDARATPAVSSGQVCVQRTQVSGCRRGSGIGLIEAPAHARHEELDDVRPLHRRPSSCRASGVAGRCF